MIDPHLRKLANQVGMRLDESRPPHYIGRAMWDGKSLGCKGMSFAHLLHDICHFMVAKPWQRELPDYGLGAGPDTSSLAQFQRKVSPEEADEQEGLTCALEYAYSRALGKEAEYVKTSYGMTLRELSEAWYRLQSRGLLDADYKPTTL